MINRRKINIQKWKKQDEIKRQDCLATIIYTLKMLKEAQENMTLRRREMNVKNPKWKIWRKIYLKWDHTDGIQFSSVKSLSRVQLFVTPWIEARQASLSITNSRSSLKLTCIKSVMPSSHLILCRPLLLLPPIPPSIRVFSNKSNLHMRWPKYWSFSLSISPSNEHPGLISFRVDWLDLLAVQGTLKSLLQHHSSKA